MSFFDNVIYGDVTLLELLWTIIILLVGVSIAKIISINLRRSLKDNLEKSQLRIVTKVAYYIVVIITLIIVIPMLGINWEGLLVAGGITALVIAFAAQSVLSNFFAGIFLFVEQPFKIGDTVNIDGNEGTVEDVKLLSTLIRGYDGYTFRLPNDKVFTNRITNFSNSPARRFEYSIGIRYSDDAKKAIELIGELIDAHKFILKNPKHHAYVAELGDNAVVIIVRMWAPTKVWYSVKMEFLGTIKTTLESNGIEMPFPQRTVWLNNVKNV